MLLLIGISTRWGYHTVPNSIRPSSKPNTLSANLTKYRFEVSTSASITWHLRHQGLFRGPVVFEALFTKVRTPILRRKGVRQDCIKYLLYVLPPTARTEKKRNIEDTTTMARERPCRGMYRALGSTEAILSRKGQKNLKMRIQNNPSGQLCWHYHIIIRDHSTDLFYMFNSHPRTMQRLFAFAFSPLPVKTRREGPEWAAGAPVLSSDLTSQLSLEG